MIFVFSIGLYPGILLGIRTYRSFRKVDHVLYLPFFDFCLTIYYYEGEDIDTDAEQDKVDD